jgi:hypothetical protein
LNINREEWISYKKKNLDENTKGVQKGVSSILTTKILMGTLGCVPAYDRFFMNGLHEYNKDEKRIIKKFGKQSLQNIIDYYLENKNTLLELRIEIKKKTGMIYPLMKIIDSYFWQWGFNVGKKD